MLRTVRAERTYATTFDSQGQFRPDRGFHIVVPAAVIMPSARAQVSRTGQQFAMRSDANSSSESRQVRFAKIILPNEDNLTVLTQLRPRAPNGTCRSAAKVTLCSAGKRAWVVLTRNFGPEPGSAGESEQSWRRDRRPDLHTSPVARHRRCQASRRGRSLRGRTGAAGAAPRSDCGGRAGGTVRVLGRRCAGSPAPHLGGGGRTCVGGRAGAPATPRRSSLHDFGRPATADFRPGPSILDLDQNALYSSLPYVD